MSDERPRIARGDATWARRLAALAEQRMQVSECVRCGGPVLDRDPAPCYACHEDDARGWLGAEVVMDDRAVSLYVAYPAMGDADFADTCTEALASMAPGWHPEMRLRQGLRRHGFETAAHAPTVEVRYRRGASSDAEVRALYGPSSSRLIKVVIAEGPDGHHAARLLRSPDGWAALDLAAVVERARSAWSTLDEPDAVLATILPILLAEGVTDLGYRRVRLAADGVALPLA
jgi:hypothetical protein